MQTVGPYQIVRELGRGGMGVVYEVRHPGHPRPLALKLILQQAVSQTALTRFQREAEVMARVQHPGVVVVHTFGHAPQGPYIVTELVEGEPLDKRIDEGPFEPKAAAKILRGLADAMAAVHETGVLHRDLKPANVILRPDGSPVVLDFGVAHDESAETLTRTGTFLGTLHYMSPEQLRGKLNQVGPPSDVYSLGAVLYALLTNEPPFAGVDGLSLISAVVSQSVRPPSSVAPGVSPALEAICVKAMAPTVGDRYPTAEALRKDLDRFLAGKQVNAPRLNASTPVGKVLALFAAALLLALGIGVALRESPTEEASEAKAATGTTQQAQRASAETLADFARLSGRAFADRKLELKTRFPDSRDELKRISDSRRSLVVLVRGNVPPQAAAEWRRSYSGVHVPEALRKKYLRASVSKRPPKPLATLESAWASFMLVNDQVITRHPQGKTRLARWNLEDSSRAFTLTVGYGSSWFSWQDPQSDRLLYLCGGKNEFAVVETTSALTKTKTFMLSDADVPAGMRPTGGAHRPSAIAASGEYVAVGFIGGRIDLFDLEFRYVRTLPTKHVHRVISLEFPSDRVLLSSGGITPPGLDIAVSGTLRAWDLSTPPRLIGEVDLKNKTRILASSRSPKGVVLAVGVHGARQVHLYSFQQNAFARKRVLLGTDVQQLAFRATRSMEQAPESAAFSPDGKRIYVGAGVSEGLGTAELRVWDTTTGAELAKRIGHPTGRLVGLAVTRDGTRLVSCAPSGPKTSVVEVWDVDLPPDR